MVQNSSLFFMDNTLDKKIQRSDHDLLIRLETKLDQVCVDIKDLKDGFSAKLANHEIRITAMEKLHDEINPLDALTRLNKIQIKQHDFGLMWQFIVIGIIGGSSIITWILTTLGETFHILGK